MRISIVAWFALLIAASASVVAQDLIVPNSPDLLIRTQRRVEGQAGAIEKQTVYLKGARQRREMTVGRTSTGEHVLIWITQCDERRMLQLYDAAKTYAYEPIEDAAAYAARIKAEIRRRPPAPASQPQAGATGPVVTITTDTVDTGERRRFGPYIARHVITTTTTEPGYLSRWTKNEQDGWYVDLPDRNCGGPAGRTGTALIMTPPGSQVQFKYHGTPNSGYPIEETTRSGDESRTFVSKLELIEMSEAPLDDALFTVPAGYRPALPSPYGGYDLSKPDTLLNRLTLYRDEIVLWANYWASGWFGQYGRGY